MDLLTLERHTQVSYAVLASSLAFVSLVPGLMPAWAVMTLLAAVTLGTGVLHGTARAVESLFMDMERKHVNKARAADGGEHGGPADGADGADEPESYDEGEELTARHALAVPLVGSIALLAMFYAYQYNIVMVLVTMYIAFVAGVAVYVNLAHMADLLRMGGWVTHDYALMAAASVVVGAWWVTDLPFLANVLAMAMGLLMLKTTQLSSIKAGFILLSGLFLYDIFWVFGSQPVFGSNVMVSVAKGIQAPIKLLIPRLDAAGNVVYGILGLGDIVVPGFFLKLLLRYDLRKALNHVVQDEPADAGPAGDAGAGSSAADAAGTTRRAAAGAATKGGSSPNDAGDGDSEVAKGAPSAGEQAALEWATVLPSRHLCQPVPPFFTAGMCAYVGSLVLTHVVMTAFQSAQPALLYIVPAVCGCAVLQAALRGELGQFLGFKVASGFLPIALQEDVVA